MCRTARFVLELFPVITYPWAGALKWVKTWIDSGWPLKMPAGKKTKRKSLPQVAIDRGFLTPTEILLDREATPRRAGPWHIQSIAEGVYTPSRPKGGRLMITAAATLAFPLSKEPNP
jgi:hypothetical protein